MKAEKVWVWFKGGLKGGYWMDGFYSKNTNEEIVSIEKPEFVSCKVPLWRISTIEPKNIREGPDIPTNTEWKYI